MKVANITGKEIPALVDTGSSCCLIRKSVADKLNAEMFEEFSQVFGFGSTKKPAGQSIGKIIADVEIDGVLGKDIDIFVVSDSAQPVDIIIGRSWLDLPHVAYAKFGKNLMFVDAEVNPFSVIEHEENKRKCELVTDQACKLKSNSVSLLKARAEGIEDGLIVAKISDCGEESVLEVIDGKTVKNC